MARLLKILLAVLLTGTFASGSAFATIHNLGVLFPGSTAPLFGAPAPGTSFEDVYSFDIGGFNSTVGVSAVSLSVIPGAASTFPITGELLAFNGSTFDSLAGPVTGAAVILNADVPMASGGDASSDGRHYEFVISGTAPATGVSSYGGSLAVAAAVPEPSSVAMIIGGLLCVGSLALRKMAQR